MAAPPPALAAVLRQVCADLEAAAARFALVGGLAVSARAEPRLTRDVDVAVAVANDAEAESVIHRLLSSGYVLVSLVEQTRRGRLATARLVPPASAGVIVDLLFATCGIEPEIVSAAETIEILPGLRVAVARTSHLIAMKLLARDDRRRPQDHDDLRALLATATGPERRRVARAIELIQDRGFARGRDLAASWHRLRS